MRALALTLAPLLLFAGLLSAAIGWLLNDEQGTRWLLRALPGVTATATRGSLLGEFSAERVEIALPGALPTALHRNRIVIYGLGWAGIAFAWPEANVSWVRVSVDRVQAERVDVQFAPDPDAPPLALPTSLALPIELEIRALKVAELHVAALGEEPLRDLEARLVMGADGGALHRIDGLAFGRDRLAVRGDARIGTALPFAVDARLAITPRAPQADATRAAFDATLVLHGPLDKLALSAVLRGEGPVQGAHAQGPAQTMAPSAAQSTAPTTKQAQSLDLEATLLPFASWPLATLTARTQSLDLSALLGGAPRTALSGSVKVMSVAADQPASADVSLDNARAGRSDEGWLPIRSLRAELSARPDDVEQVEIRRFALELGTLRERGGSISGSGHWAPSRAVIEATLAGIVPQTLDTRAPPMRLGGSVRFQADDWPAPASGTHRDPVFALRGRIDGQLPRAGAMEPVQLDLDVNATPQRVVLNRAAVQAGAARAVVTGQATRQPRGAWQVKAEGSVTQFNPALWWPGAQGSAWQSGVHRLNGALDIDLLVPADAASMTLARLAQSQGRAMLRIADSELAGKALAGELGLRGEGAGGLDVRGQFTLSSAQVDLKGRFAADGGDHWEIAARTPDLAPLAPLLKLVQAPAATLPALTGAVDANATVDGRWPAISSGGNLKATGARFGDWRIERADAHWSIGSAPQAPLDVRIDLAQGSVGVRKLDSLKLVVQGTTAEHRIAIDAASPVRPPSWVDALHVAPAGAGTATGTTGTLAELRATGALTFDTAGQQPVKWNLQLQQLQARRRADAVQAPWFSAKAFDAALQYDPLTRTPQLSLSPGRVELTQLALRWSALRWRGGATPALEMQAEVEPFSVAPLMARLQPEFGWSGDLIVGGKIDIRSAPSFVAAIEFGRRSGDLSVTDEVETHKLELTDLRIALDAKDGVWHFTHALAGRTLGAMAGAVTLRTSPRAIWPPADAPLQGVMELRIDDLGAWGAWVPAGWRLRGALHASASAGGSFGAPEFTGKIEGSQLGLRNLLEGIDLNDGELEIALEGETAHIVKLRARGGDGTVEVSGGATFGAQPQAKVRVVADKLLLLGRVDRQIVASGDATLQLDPKRLAVAGHIDIDRGLIDFSRGSAPSLASDVTVVREPSAEQKLASASAAAGGREVDVNLRLNLGQALRIRGRGLDTRLRGELTLTTPGGRVALHGTVNTARGTYAAYNQKLEIERGAVIFSGPPDNPRLDILALRPNLDVRVGVAVTGSAAVPRISLYSEPDLPDADKLSWLVLGRAPVGLGGSDIALLQAAAAALLAGEGDTPSAQLTQLIGLDTLSVRQSEGEVRDTVVSVGKQLSRRWYIGYERSLSSTAGNWQLIYRLAQRFTVRLQTGLDNSIDLIWTWRWD